MQIVTSKADRLTSAAGMVCRGHAILMCVRSSEQWGEVPIYLDLFFLSEMPRLHELKDVTRRRS